jgi:hypothetical protein
MLGMMIIAIVVPRKAMASADDLRPMGTLERRSLFEDGHQRLRADR